jgi:murein DD-endopeptidase MepM/ murein hydrolase activator NlpD
MRRMRLPRRLPAALLAGLTIVSGTLAFVLHEGVARSAGAGSLSSRLANSSARESSLSSQIASDTARLASVSGSIARVQRNLAAIESDLAAKRAQLAQTQTALRLERARLVKLQLQLANADAALAKNLVAQYEADPPDALTVVLESHGFADMLERLDFMKRAKQQDTEVIKADQAARTAVIAEATRLGKLEQTQQKLASAVLARRNEIDSIRLALVSRQIRLERARSAKASALGAARAEAARLRSQLARLQATQIRSSAPSFSGHVLSSGGFVFPMPGGAASPPGTWSNDQGVDISAAGHTPLLAVGSGTIVLHGIGGFGPSAPVLHLDSPIAGYSYVYYGHAGPGNMVPIGTHVSAGQVISEVGAGIVGISTGPHLEIGFADASGGPIGPGSSPTMHALLLGAYHG